MYVTELESTLASGHDRRLSSRLVDKGQHALCYYYILHTSKNLALKSFLYLFKEYFIIHSKVAARLDK